MPGGGAEGFIEFLPKGLHERFMQKLVDSDAFPAALGEGVGTDVPAMQIQGLVAPGQRGVADVVEASG